MAKIDQKQLNNTLKKLDALKKPLTKKGAEKLGRIVVKEMKKDIASLKSPIRGKGRFLALQEPYKSRKRRLGKGDKPNLKLSGDFLRSLKSVPEKGRGGWFPVIGFTDAESDKKEQGHRDGQRKRPIIPTGSEGFNRRISAIILDFMNTTVGGIIRKK